MFLTIDLFRFLFALFSVLVGDTCRHLSLCSSFIILTMVGFKIVPDKGRWEQEWSGTPQEHRPKNQLTRNMGAHRDQAAFVEWGPS